MRWIKNKPSSQQHSSRYFLACRLKETCQIPFQTIEFQRFRVIAKQSLLQRNNPSAEFADQICLFSSDSYLIRVSAFSSLNFPQNRFEAFFQPHFANCQLSPTKALHAWTHLIPEQPQTVWKHKNLNNSTIIHQNNHPSSRHVWKFCARLSTDWQISVSVGQIRMRSCRNTQLAKLFGIRD